MATKRIEKEEEEQAEAARSEEDLDTLPVKDAHRERASAAFGEMTEDDDVVNEDEEDLDDLEEEEEEAAEDAETSNL